MNDDEEKWLKKIKLERKEKERKIEEYNKTEKDNKRDIKTN